MLFVSTFGSDKFLIKTKKFSTRFNLEILKRSNPSNDRLAFSSLRGYYTKSFGIANTSFFLFFQIEPFLIIFRYFRQSNEKVTKILTLYCNRSL